MRSLLLLGLCALLHADQYPRQPGIDVQHYTFRVTLSDDTDEIEGETTVTVRFVQDGVRGFSLDLAAPMTVTEVSAPYRRDPEKVQISLDLAPKKGDLGRFSIKYRGKPASGLRILRNKFGDRCFFSTNWPDLAHQWLPTVDHPYDKASGEFLITAPARYQVVANGALAEQTDLPGGQRVTHWVQRAPIATWLYNIGVARFAVRHFGTLETWVFPQDRDKAIFEGSARRAIDFFISHIGPYPYDKLAHVQAAGFHGGMEHASAIFYGDLPGAGLIAHETAHQWFGDSVTEKDWDDVWLSEGFATYFGELAGDPDKLAKTMQDSRNQLFATEKRLPGVAVVQAKPWKGIPNAIVYQKGGWVLHMLRGQLGDAKFWEGIREYYRRYRDSNASTDDFRRVMEEVSGQDLRAWFQQWLYRAGSPELAVKWDVSGTLELEQTQPGEAYRLPLEVAVGNRTERIEMTQKRQRFQLPAAPAVTLDPNTRLLCKTP